MFGKLVWEIPDQSEADTQIFINNVWLRGWPVLIGPKTKTILSPFVIQYVAVIEQPQ